MIRGSRIALRRSGSSFGLDRLGCSGSPARATYYLSARLDDAGLVCQFGAFCPHAPRLRMLIKVNRLAGRRPYQNVAS